MAELPPRVMELLDEAREADEPAPGDRSRVHASLMAAIAAGTPPSLGDAESGASSPSSGASGSAAVSGTALKWGGVLLASAIAGAVMVSQPWREAPSAVPAAAPQPQDEAAAEPVRANAERGQGDVARGRDEASAPADARPGEAATSDTQIASARTDEAQRDEGEAQRDEGEAQRDEGEAQRDERGVQAGAGEARGSTSTDTAALDAPRPRRAPATPHRAKHAAAAPAVALAASPTSTDEALEPVQADDAQPAEDEAAQAEAAREAEPAEREAATSSGRRELALIQAATRSLSAGELTHAMGLLEQHAELFPRGVLAQERDGLHVLTLCKLGRVAEGRSEQARFLEHAPSSPMAARVRAACGGEREP